MTPTRRRAIGVGLGLLALAPGLRAAEPAREGDFVVRGFRFASGETLPEVRIHYRTLGTPRRDARGRVNNAVLLLHGTGGSGAQFLQPQFAGELFGEGQLLDAGRHFLVLPDNVGHGASSKPSDGLRLAFPRYTYDDMVALQHRLLTESLAVDHLQLVLGTSMGGMHAWMWGYRHPGFADGLVPLASVPTAIVGRNRVWRKALQDEIRSDPAWSEGRYAEQPRVGVAGAQRLLILMGAAPIQWQADLSTRAAADVYLEAQVERRMAAADANDMLYQFDASRDYDPSPHLERIVDPVLAVNSADDLINPPELGLMERLMPRVARGRYVLLPATERTRGHSSHTWAVLWKDELARFLNGLGSQAGAAAAPTAPRTVAAEIEALERQLLAALEAKDLAAYDRLVADDYVAVRPSGPQTKAQVLATYRAGGLAYRGLDIAEVEVHVYGDTAALSARTLGFRIEDGTETENRVRYVRLWARRNGSWRAVMQMATPLPRP